MDAQTLAAARIQRFLAEEPIVWLSTVRPDGAPHIVPIWFWWDGEALLVFSKPEAQKVRNLRADARVMLALGDAEDDFDVGMLEGVAELVDAPTAAVLPAAHLEKYRSQLGAIGLDADEYAATYSQVIRIRPARYLGWHGRTVPASARLAGAPTATITEPARTELPNFGRWLGEPLAGLRGLVDTIAGPATGTLPAAS
jgi:PPOX class probable F420-dependent enzyme